MRPLAARFPPARTLAQRLAAEVLETRERMRLDRELALLYFNQYRSKAELLDAARTTWRTYNVTDLLQLRRDQVLVTTAYFETLSRFRLWVTATEAMPATMEARYDLALQRVEVLGDAALVALGGTPPEAPHRVVPPGWGTLERAPRPRRKR